MPRKQPSISHRDMMRQEGQACLRAKNSTSDHIRTGWFLQGISDLEAISNIAGLPTGPGPHIDQSKREWKSNVIGNCRRMAGGPPGLGVDVSLFDCASKPTVPTVACASKRTLTVPTGSTCQTIQCLHPRTATLDLFQFMPISCLPKALSYTPGPLLLCASLAVVSLKDWV